jgi:hypothetical protein
MQDVLKRILTVNNFGDKSGEDTMVYNDIAKYRIT